MASCRVLNCGYFGTKSKVIGQEEGVMIFLTIFKIDGWHFFYEFSKFDVKYLVE